jgi:lysophospholipase L1-like esterase
VIVCLGDSTTAGTPLFRSPVEAPPDGEGDERSQFPYWLRHAHPEWEAFNAGVNGERTDQIAARFDRDVLARRARLVIIIAGVNDIYQNFPADHVTTQLAMLYDRAAEAGLAVIAGTIVPYNTATTDQNFRMHSVNDWIKAEATKRPHFQVADTRAAAADPGNPNLLSGSPDGLHPDIDGYRRMAAAIEPLIVRALG